MIIQCTKKSGHTQSKVQDASHSRSVKSICRRHVCQIWRTPNSELESVRICRHGWHHGAHDLAGSIPDRGLSGGLEEICNASEDCHVMIVMSWRQLHCTLCLQGWNDVRQCQPPLSRQKLRCKPRREKPPTFLSSHHQICTRTSTGIPVKILHCKFLRISSTKSGISQICFAVGTCQLFFMLYYM